MNAPNQDNTEGSETHTYTHWCTPGCEPGCDIDQVEVTTSRRVVKRRQPLTKADIEWIRERIFENRGMTSAQIVERQKEERRDRAEQAARRLRGE